jgi:hypothetical protein
MTKWTEFVKQFAKKNSMSYGCAMSNPMCSKQYKEMKNPTTVKPEDRLKNLKTLRKAVVSRRQERAFDPPTSLDTMMKKSRPAPSVRKKGRGMRNYMDGYGLSMMSSHEDANGLTHIYPLTHKMIKNMIRGF